MKEYEVSDNILKVEQCSLKVLLSKWKSYDNLYNNGFRRKYQLAHNNSKEKKWKINL
jgi:hypothetical protein